jgi:hypothetical protein
VPVVCIDDEPEQAESHAAPSATNQAERGALTRCPGAIVYGLYLTVAQPCAGMANENFLPPSATT